MPTFVTSDQTVLAIVQGMRSRRFVRYRDRGILADALRSINEAITWEQWRKDGCLPFDLTPVEVIEAAIAEESDKPHGLKPWQIRELAWEVAVEANHVKVKFTRDRPFSDEEIWSACNCWLRQVCTGSGLLEKAYEDGDGVEHFDYLTVIGAVKKLKLDLQTEHVHDKTWKARCWFGHWHMFMKAMGEGGEEEWVDIEKAIPGDLAA